MKVRTADCAGARSATVAALASAAGGMRIASGTCSRCATGIKFLWLGAELGRQKIKSVVFHRNRYLASFRIFIDPGVCPEYDRGNSCHHVFDRAEIGPCVFLCNGSKQFLDEEFSAVCLNTISKSQAH
jgi:hypothetical protein